MAADLVIEIELDVKKLQTDLVKYLFKPFKNSFTKSTEFLFSEIAANAPGTLRPALQFESEIKEDLSAVGFIGYPKGSKLDKIANYTDMGTGQRGSESFRSFFGETKPIFTIPIKPLRAKVLHWKSSDNSNIFAKTTKGQKGQAWFRKSIFDNLTNIKTIWEKEFREA